LTNFFGPIVVKKVVIVITQLMTSVYFWFLVYSNNLIMLQAAASDDNPMDHSPKIRSLLTGAIASSVTPSKNPLGLSVDAFLLESNQQNLAER
jgi:hypothetical protein